MSNTSKALLVAAMFLAACSDGGDGSGTGGAGGGGGSGATEAEKAACENLWSFTPTGADPGCASGANEGECETSLAGLRTDYAEPKMCTDEYDAWLACLTKLTDCQSGQQCPDEYTVFQTCSGAP